MCKARVNNLLEGVGVYEEQQLQRKKPVTPEIIQRLVTQYGSVSANLADLRLLIFFVLGYGFFFFALISYFNRAVVIFSLKILL